ncbi:sensor histidine kinase [Consotaella salsifontis]|uniref:histidine kinase n=1 Tax=Consotaella salsifontis TaxID=1365950 RepID=A0A1T4RNZ2_9HYPH|nr:sensor histidine kinase KdpD [Consotaella salsifontis]SKA17672.1 two-component system, OmpR family, sensor histidine kinase KdpD [Consotaella salsifontis]
MSDTETRPEPEALLAEAAREGRGKLKVFLGAAPGVGKTFAMLEAARMRRTEGVDVVVAVVETHGRAETERLLAGLEIIPRSHLFYRGRALPEMNLDGVLARKPALALVDELAHTNVEGSRHAKRWQDVDELLTAGIDVYTTLNVQHIESLNDVVARISGVRVRETVPDTVLEIADDVELIDLPPDELIARLRQGKVYIQEQIARAIQNFFSKGNLTALRELAMRVAADRVDAQMTAHMRTHAIPGPWPTRERILVCVNEAPAAKSLVRATKRMAERARLPWIALSVVTASSEQLPEKEKDARVEALRLAETLGAEVVTINAASNVADEVLAFARARNVARIVIGRPRLRRFVPSLMRETVADTILKQAVDFEVTVVSPDAKAARETALRAGLPPIERRPKAYLWSALAVALASAAAQMILSFMPVESLALVFLPAVLFASARYGLVPSIFASFLAFLTYNFFFTEPYHTFNVYRESEILTLLLFLVVSIVTGNQTARLRRQAAAQKAIAERTTRLYEFARKIASAASLDDVVWAAVHHVAATLHCDALLLGPNENGRLTILGGFPPEDQLDARDWGAANWAFAHKEAAGWSSVTLPASSWLFLPLGREAGINGLLGVKFKQGRYPSPDDRRLLDALVDQIYLAMERTRLASDMEETRLLSETERLRAALLSSVSHDLRTPLVSIIGAASSLLEAGDALTDAGRHALAETIFEEGERLNRYVQNLLDMTRLSYGALKIRRETIDVREILGGAARRLAHALGTHRLVVDLPEDLPLVDGDPVLLEQVITNVLDNAAKYAPAETDIAVSAMAAAGRMALSISDEGPGIPLEDRRKVFDMFYRVRAGDGQKAGTGLGLAICQGILDAHGGSIRAEPAHDDGGGTRIVIELPVAEHGGGAPLGDSAAPEGVVPEDME